MPASSNIDQLRKVGDQGVLGQARNAVPVDGPAGSCPATSIMLRMMDGGPERLATPGTFAGDRSWLIPDSEPVVLQRLPDRDARPPLARPADRVRTRFGAAGLLGCDQRRRS